LWRANNDRSSGLNWISMKQKLVIVESPAKAKTLAKILGKGYNLMASLGHVRDLPKSRIGVDIENGFAPAYVIPTGKKKVVNELKKAAESSSAVFLATDPDREGEAISWHLAEVTDGTGTKIPYLRVVFHEITEVAIQQAFKHPRELDMQLVNAQQARRVLDRLVGYKISPILWRKVRRGLSAGRVQSVALKIIVDREREIEKFIPVEYWSLEALLSKKSATAKTDAFKAMLAGLVGATRIEIHNQEEAGRLKEKLGKAAYSVLKVNTKKALRQPAPPFITSTLQQEAWRQLRFPAKRTMALAQQLYEGLPVGDEGDIGLITYMRTDSTHVASSAVAETRDFIKAKFGEEYLPPQGRVFTRVSKNAQEAHEAIRPTRTHREPKAIKQFLSEPQFKLYELIWKRMVASEMAAAEYENTSVDIEAKCTQPDEKYLFKSSSSELRFPGFTTLYIEGKDEDDNEKLAVLPRLEKGDALKLLELLPEQHFTQPPPRFTEATLVKMLEQQGIGRPSTYAPILSTIEDREYVTKTKGTFKPTDLGFVVSDLLAEHFSTIVDIKFTARMEDELDSIAQDNKNWVEVVQDFYTPLAKDLENASENIERVKLPEEITEEKCPKCGKPMAVKTGRFGRFLACTGYPECKSTKPFQKKTGAKCPECGSDIVERMSKKKRKFYGCSGYPKCTFAIFSKPVEKPCPECKGLMVMQSDKMVKCTKCSHREKIEEKQA
jgi:DNA topoisomerase I